MNSLNLSKLMNLLTLFITNFYNRMLGCCMATTYCFSNLSKLRLTQTLLLKPLEHYCWNLWIIIVETFGTLLVHPDSVAFTAYESIFIRYPRSVGTLGSLPSVPRYEEGCTTAVRVHPLIHYYNSSSERCSSSGYYWNGANITSSRVHIFHIVRYVRAPFTFVFS